ncbi:dihydrodipicolinate synthase family protein [Amycolatopsis acidicola]|uniref:Dihydrodipicolinate synthase family protein n=1 Tax=Amycolatopsis acidicola TaxID=2596893 RepID=A0A5N0UMQ9_9PSEU|nr:dihydrodipicolinate synthase family protein [Amycolatopsis acidicola]KAA9151218.1 dihydrodipicolinate synthase family protein [Amycolatopsis acidicola]
MEVVAAVPTPFRADGDVDFAAARAGFGYVASIVDGLFVAGAEGEFPALSADERIGLFEVALAVCPGAIVHIGASEVRNAVAMAERAVELGARRFAAATPSGGISVYYQRIRDVVGNAELYAYVDPERLGVRPDPQALAEADITGTILGGSAGAEYPGRLYRASGTAAAFPRGRISQELGIPLVKQAWALRGFGGTTTRMELAPSEAAAIAQVKHFLAEFG